jgi:sec-independent protein translocase protein TatB
VFANVGWGEILVLIVVGLVVLGPERLPGAIRWTSTALRQARDYLSGMTTQLREDMARSSTTCASRCPSCRSYAA